MNKRNTIGIFTISLKYFLCLIIVFIMFMANGCSQNNNFNKNGTVSQDTLSAPIPGLLTALVLEETNLVVEVIVNSGTPQTCLNLKVDTSANTFSCDIALSEGSHTLALVYSVMDTPYGKLQLASTSGINLTIVGGQSTTANFSDVTLSNADDDADGISNLDELNEGSDPTKTSYYVGGTVVGLLGSDAVLQLNGGNDLILTKDGTVKFSPAVTDKSAYSVAILTQPKTPNQTCTVTNGDGIVDAAAVNIIITCVTKTSDVAVELTAPLAGSVLTSNVNITWNNLDPSPTRVRVLLSEDGGENFDSEIATVQNTGSFTWNTSSLPDRGSYRIRLLAIDKNGVEGNTSESKGNFTLDNTPPVVTITSPGSGQILQGSITNMSWITADANPDLVTIQLSNNSGQSYDFDLVSGLSDTRVFQFDTTTFPDGTNYKIRIVSTDKAGNVSAPALSAGNFTIQNSGPVQGPQVFSTVLFQDINFNNLVDAGDKLIVPFSQNIQINNVQASDFNLPVVGDSLGLLPAFNIGAAPHELVITLGQNAKLTTKVNFDNAVIQLGSASGIDVSSTITPGAITTTDGLISAQSSTPVDIFPTFVESSLLRVCTTSGISIGDVNNDGFADIAQACDSSATIGTIIHINDKKGNFTEGPSVAPNLANGVKLADINNDTFLDIIEINRSAAANSTHKASVIYLNDKNGGFTFHQTLGVDSHTAYGLAVGDIDNDQDLDLVIGRYNLPSFVYINNAGVFSKHAIEIPATKISEVYLKHINSDTFLDLIIAGHNKFDHIIYTGNGDGTFTQHQRINNPVGAYMAFEKLNNDAFLDIIFAVSGQANQVFYNDGTGTFSDAGKPFGTSSPFGIALIDIDGDSDFDIVEGTDFNAPGLVWINSGAEVFVDSGARLANRQTRAMDVGDLDNDGDLDIVFGNAAQNSGIWKGSYATP